MPDDPLPLTIRALAGLEASGPVPPLSDAERQELVESIRDHMRRVTVLSKLDLGHRLLGALGTAMEEPLADVLKEYWKQRAELRNVAAKKGAEREVTGDVELVDHSWTWKLRPSVTLEARTTEGTLQFRHTVHFTVATKLSLKGVKLVMRNACVTNIEAGTLSAETTLTYDAGDGEGKHFPLLPAIKRSVELPGRLTLPRGGLCLG